MDAFGSILDTVFVGLLRVSWQAGLLAIIIPVAQRVLRDYLSPRWCEALWVVLLIRLFLPWTPSSSLSVYNVPFQAASRVSTFGMFAEPARSVQERAPLAGANAMSGGVETGHSAEFPWLRFGGCCWLAGASVMAAFMVLQNLWLSGAMAKRRVLTNAEALELLESSKSEMGVNTWIAPIVTSRVQSPALLGVVRPRLLLPETWQETTTAEQLRHIFLHEMAHVRRRDVLWGWVWSLLVALHWFNPLLWWARSRIGRDRELACDARVVSILTERERLLYGRTLLGQFQHFRQLRLSYGAAGVLERAANMKRRITMVLDYRETSWVGKAIALAALLAIGLLGLTDAQTGTAVDVNGTIVPGRGLAGIGVGDTGSAIPAKLGPPDSGSEERCLRYRHHLCLDFYLNGEGIVREMRFNDGYNGKTVDGVGIGDSIDAAIKASGGASKTVQANREDTHGASTGRDRVLYEMQSASKTEAYKFIDENRGILYWSGADKKITQIVAFTAAGKDDSVASQKYPFTIFSFAAKAGTEANDSGALLDLFNTDYPKNVRCRTHHYRTATVDGRLIGFICADNAEAIATMLKGHPKLECLSSRVIETPEVFEKYLRLSNNERGTIGLSF